MEPLATSDAATERATAAMASGGAAGSSSDVAGDVGESVPTQDVGEHTGTGDVGESVPSIGDTGAGVGERGPTCAGTSLGEHGRSRDRRIVPDGAAATEPADAASATGATASAAATEPAHAGGAMASAAPEPHCGQTPGTRRISGEQEQSRISAGTNRGTATASPTPLSNIPLACTANAEPLPLQHALTLVCSLKTI